MRAVPNDYVRRSMEELEIAALAILRESSTPVRCGSIGIELFPDAILRGSAPFARIAGKVMRRLQKAGKVAWGCKGSSDWSGWYIVDAAGNQ